MEKILWMVPWWDSGVTLSRIPTLGWSFAFRGESKRTHSLVSTMLASHNVSLSSIARPHVRSPVWWYKLGISVLGRHQRVPETHRPDTIMKQLWEQSSPTWQCGHIQAHAPLCSSQAANVESICLKRGGQSYWGWHLRLSCGLHVHIPRVHTHTNTHPGIIRRAIKFLSHLDLLSIWVYKF